MPLNGADKAQRVTRRRSPLGRGPSITLETPAHEGIEVELVVGNVALNLSRREADVALRVGNAPAETLVGRRVGRLAFAVYARADYRARRPEPDFALHDWIGFDSEHEALVRRMAGFLPEVKPVLRTNSVAAALSAAKAGMGLAPLPCGLADLETDLVRIAPLPDEFTLDLWLLTHEDLRQTARIRAFLDFLAEALAKEAPLLEGMSREAMDAPLHGDLSKLNEHAPAAGR